MLNLERTIPMKKTIFRPALLIATLLGIAATLPAVRAESALLGNKALAGQTLDADAVKAVLLGKKVTIGDKRVVIVIGKTGEAQDKFLQQFLGMTSSQFQTHWRRLFMTGGGSAPKIVDNEEAAVQLVSETPGAIAMVDKAKAADLPVLASGN